MPLLFERNQGQFSQEIEFVARGSGMDLSLDRHGATLSLVASGSAKNAVARTLRMTFVGGRAASRVKGTNQLATKVNYLVGRDSRRWRTGISTYERVALENVYPGVDAAYYGNGRSLEYDFVVAPDANPNAIRLRFHGADSLHFNERGDLVLRLGKEEIVQHAPVIYQTVQGHRVPVAGRYALHSRFEVGFALGRYNKAFPLVIDPTLVYSTYVGGPVGIYSMAVGADGSVFIAGRRTINANVIAGQKPTIIGPGGFLFVAKVSSAGDKLEYLTYTGGTQTSQSAQFNFETIYGLAVDKGGNAYMVGLTNVTDLPLRHPYQASLSPYIRDRDYNIDAFLLKLNPKGDTILYGTYLGGSATSPAPSGVFSARDEANAVAVDEEGNAYLTGLTEAANFPIVGGFQTQLNASQYPTPDAFLAKINTNAETDLEGTKSLVYSTYLGSSGEDKAFAVATAGQGKVYVVGQTTDGNDFEDEGEQGVPFPKKGTVIASGTALTPGFIAQIDTRKDGLNSLVASVLLDGNSSLEGDEGDPPQTRCIPHSIALGKDGSVYLAGVTNLNTLGNKSFTVFGTANAQDFRNAFVLKLKSDLSSIVYADLLAGSRGDMATSVAVDSQNQVHVAGFTFSPDFPQRNPLPHIPAASSDVSNDFAAKIASSGDRLIYLTSIGGSKGEDEGSADERSSPTVAVDAQGNAYVAGNTYSPDFPTTPKSLQPAMGDTNNVATGFLLKFQGEGLYVNSMGDSNDSDEATKEYDGTCGTGNTLSDGQPECTLRAAIQEANHAKIKPTINFRITAGVASGAIPKISLKSSLPSLDVPMTVDGTTQPGVNRVWLNGVSGGNMSGLVVAGGDSLVAGLLINQVRGDGILIRTKGNNKIENCWVGLSDKGIADSKTGVAGSGVHILNSPGNIVGGASESKRCVLSGNGGNGVWIDGAKSTNNSVQGCFIGTDVSGTQKAGNKIGISIGPEKTQTTVLALNAQIGGSSGVPGTGAGNVISANRFGGVVLGSSSGARVQGNLIGTDKTGTKALGNNIGVNVFAAPGNIIGGSPNVISGNAFGIALLLSATTGNSVQNNLVGTDIKGDKALPNDTGIVLCASSGNSIGSNGRNVVSGNKQAGVALVAEIQYGEPVNGVPQFIKGAANKNTLAQNYLGLDKSGTKALPNTVGLTLDKCENTTVSKNVVSGNSTVGVFMQGRCFKTNFSSNLVGTNAGGTSAVPNTVYGVLIQESDYNVFDGNTLSGNGVAGLVLGGAFPPGVPAPLKTEPSGPLNNTFTRNFIGTNSGGTSALPNGSASTSGSGAGVLVLPNPSGDAFTGASNNLIGTSGKGNVISGNRGAGVLFVGMDGADEEPRNAANATLQSNFIGTGASGKSGVPNSDSGVRVVKGTARIGGSGTLGNTIAFNGGDGLTVVSGSGNAIVGNAIFSNKKLGIDLGGDGVTTNSTTGSPNSKRANLGQNFPELLAAQVAGDKTTVVALLKAAPKATYRIEFFVNGTRDPSGYGEGEKFISAANVTTDSSGVAKFSTTLGVTLSGTQSLSMTATNDKGNTSEFSGLSRAITGRVYVTVTDPKNTKATIKQGLVNLRVERLDSKGAVKEVTGTDAEGNYVFVGVPDGTWTIKPSSKTGTFDTQFDPATLKATVSASKPTVSGLDFTTYSIYGVVKDVVGKPLTNQTVSLVGLGRNVKTGKDGSYRFDGLGKKQYDVEFGDSFSPKFKIVSLPTSGTAGVSPNARVDAQQGLSLSGFVEDASGKPLANVPIELVGTKVVPVVTDNHGRYEFEALPAGNYKVAPQSSAGKFTPASRSVILKDKSMESVDFTKVTSTTNAFSGNDS